MLPILGVGEIGAGADLARALSGALLASGLSLQSGDVVVVSSKVVSKALGLTAATRDEGIEAGTRRVVAERLSRGRRTAVVEATAGPVMAAAGVDTSNTGPSESVLVLPDHPDAAALVLRDELATRADLPRAELAVVLSDTAGRPWRVGQTDFALGSAGLAGLDDLRESLDADGRSLQVTARAVADEIAAAADLVKGKAWGVPAAVVRGLTGHLVGSAAIDGGAAELVRTGSGDWFAYGHVEGVRAALGVEPGSSAAFDAGIPSADPEPLADRVARAVRVAMTDGSGWSAVAYPQAPADDRIDLEVEAEDAYAAGRLAARLQVSLWAEGLQADAARTDERTTGFTVTPRPA